MNRLKTLAIVLALMGMTAGSILAQDMEIIINADDAYELWVNGSYVGGNSQWDSAKTYRVQVQNNKNVLAIYGRNRGSSARGIIVEVRVDGKLVLQSGPEWRGSSTAGANWQSLNYAESGWSAVEDYGSYGASPWGRKIQNFPGKSGARWIWGAGPGQETYLRGSFSYTLAVMPDIIAIEPDSGATGTLVTLLGKGLEGTKHVSFDGILADSMAAISGQQLQVVVPRGARSGAIRVTTDAGGAYSPNAFTVIRQPPAEVIDTDGEGVPLDTIDVIEPNDDPPQDTTEVVDPHEGVPVDTVEVVEPHEDVPADSVEVFEPNDGVPVDTVEVVEPNEDVPVDTSATAIPGETPVSPDTVVTVIPEEDDAVSDTSRVVLPGEELTVDFPSGGELLPGNSTWIIRWHSDLAIPQVDLSYSVNHGLTWTPIATNLDNSGHFRWQVPNLSSTEAAVRIVDATNPLVGGMSDTLFTIIANDGVWPAYDNSVYAIPVAEPVLQQQLFVIDLNGDGLKDFSYRSEANVFAFDHYGTEIWRSPLVGPYGGGGAKHTGADIDQDGVTEIMALDDQGRLFVYDGISGVVESVFIIPQVGSDNYWTHVVVANLRGSGDRDLIFQTRDLDGRATGVFYINRNLLAWDMENNQEIWRVEQDADLSDGIYEGYWGLAHGPFQTADVDGDGLDEVLGGNMIDHDGRIVDLGYPRDWVGTDGNGFVDHFDCLTIGDFRPDLPGLEWIITEEDHAGNEAWHTTMMSVNGIIWRQETQLFSGKGQEPQNVAAGNLDPQKPFSEIWARSRFGGADESQHPWVFDAFGREYAGYATSDVLPPTFNGHEYGNYEGIEIISVIDWDGGDKEYIAGKARHVNGNIGVFDAVTGQAVWHTAQDSLETQATLIYGADIAGDSREEIIIYDQSGELRVYSHPQRGLASGKKRKWEDPLYGRFKLNWNYYSPAGYIYDVEASGSESALSFVRGESALNASSKYELSWITTGDITEVNLDYSLDNGSHWTAIVANAPNTGSLVWTVPDTVSQAALLRISDARNGSAADTSQVFAILPRLAEMEITIAVDDEFDLWVNGVHRGSNSQWDQARKYLVPFRPGENVIAVHGRNRGGSRGLIAEVKIDGETILATDENWKFSAEGKSGWTDVDFDDSAWPRVNDQGGYGDDPWSTNIKGIPHNSRGRWIWGDEQTDYFRISFTVDPGHHKRSLVTPSAAIQLPDDYDLLPNYPNPFNGATQFQFYLPRDSRVKIRVFDLLGRFMAQVAQDDYSAGYHSLIWEARDPSGRPLPSGVYLFQIQAGAFTQVRKMILLR